jgi:hypothetical protein
MLLHFLNPHVVHCFPLSHLLFDLCNLVASGSVYVPVTYMRSLGYFSAWSPILSDGHPSERLLLTGVRYVQSA